MILASPLAAFLRALLLGGSAITPLFIVIMGGFSSLAIAAWRVGYWLYSKKKGPDHE